MKWALYAASIALFPAVTARCRALLAQYVSCFKGQQHPISKQTKVLVVGGGSIGSPSALYAARRGCNVELYDLRDDPNYGDPSARPDIAVIPLALSEGGIRAIAGADTPGLLEGILDGSRPIYTRMVHTKNSAGEHKEIPMIYGPQGQCLHTIQREKVTKHVMLGFGTVKIFAGGFSEALTRW